MKMNASFRKALSSASSSRPKQLSSPWIKPCKCHFCPLLLDVREVYDSYTYSRQIYLLTAPLFRANQDLNELSSLGHFLKGSSATLGLTKVKDSCEKIQHYGARKDERGNDTMRSDPQLLELIKSTLADVKKEYKEAEKALKRFYQDC